MGGGGPFGGGGRSRREGGRVGSEEYFGQLNFESAFFSKIIEVARERVEKSEETWLSWAAFVGKQGLKAPPSKKLWLFSRTLR